MSVHTRLLSATRVIWVHCKWNYLVNLKCSCLLTHSASFIEVNIEVNERVHWLFDTNFKIFDSAVFQILHSVDRWYQSFAIVLAQWVRMNSNDQPLQFNDLSNQIAHYRRHTPWGVVNRFLLMTVMLKFNLSMSQFDYGVIFNSLPSGHREELQCSSAFIESLSNDCCWVFDCSAGEFELDRWTNHLLSIINLLTISF